MVFAARFILLLVILFSLQTNAHSAKDDRLNDDAWVNEQLQLLAKQAPDDPKKTRARALALAQKARSNNQLNIWSSFTGIAMNIDTHLGHWDTFERDFWADHQALVQNAEPHSGDVLLIHFMDFQGARKNRDIQAALAEQYLQRLELRHGTNSPGHIEGMKNVGKSYILTGDKKRGMAIFERGLWLARNGDDHAFTAFIHRIVANNLWRYGMSAEAGAVFDEAVKSKAARHSSKHLAHLWKSFARYELSTGRINEAIRAGVQANTLMHKEFGEGSKESIDAADWLASKLSYYGAVASGLNLAEKNYETAVKHLTHQNLLTWRVLNNYAEALRAVGRPDLAEPYDEWLLEVRLHHFGPASFHPIVSANNSAINHIAMGNKEKALELIAKQREYSVALADKTSEHVAQADAWKEYTLAKFSKQLLSVKALEKMAKIKDWNGATDILKVRTTELAAQQYEARGQFERGLALRKEAISISTQAFTPMHPETFSVRLGLANAQRAAKQNKKSLETLTALEEDLFQWMIREVGTAGNRIVAERTRYLADKILYAFSSFALEHKEAIPAFSKSAARWETLINEDTSQLATIAERFPDKTRRQMKNLVWLRSRNAEFLSAGDINEAAQENLQELRFAERDLQSTLDASEEMQAIFKRPLPSTSELLSEEEILINFVTVTERKSLRSSTSDNSQSGSDGNLLAIVHRSGEEPELINYGAVGLIINPVQSPSSQQEFFQNLDNILFSPLKSHLSGIKRVYIVPTKLFFDFPWAYLHDKNQKFLDERFEFRLLSREDALHRVNINNRLSKDDEALLVGGLDFQSKHVSTKNPITQLPFTRAEVKNVKKTLTENGVKVSVLTDDAGTEVAVSKAIDNKNIIHIATHGFYSAQNPETDALWRSAVYLSQPRNSAPAKQSKEDNVLYAHEIMDWNLTDTDLVVLSACQTGQGSDDAINSLLGLPSALKVAGAHRSMLALWSVDDQGAANFMSRFYRHLADGKTYSAALRRTRLEAIKGKIKRAQHPNLWSAFTMIEN